MFVSFWNSGTKRCHHRRFLRTSSSEIAFKNVSFGGSVQWIAWDAAAKTIRSWSFHDNGGFSESTWTQDGKKWTVKRNSVLPDGKKATGTETITFVDADTATFTATGRTLDGKPEPDIGEIKLKRVK